MKKIGILLGCLALLSCTASIASPPVPDVGKVILVDDNNIGSLTDSLLLKYNELTPLIVLEAQVASYELVSAPAIKIETPILNLVSNAAEPATVAAIRCYGEGIYNFKTSELIKEKIFLDNCCIRQCTKEAVAAATGSYIKRS